MAYLGTLLAPVEWTTAHNRYGALRAFELLDSGGRRAAAIQDLLAQPFTPYLRRAVAAKKWCGRR